MVEADGIEPTTSSLQSRRLLETGALTNEKKGCVDGGLYFYCCTNRRFAIARELLDQFQKGGDPAAGSPTATLLRLRPSR